MTRPFDSRQVDDADRQHPRIKELGDSRYPKDLGQWNPDPDDPIYQALHGTTPPKRVIQTTAKADAEAAVVTPEVVEKLKAYGRAQGFTNAQMDEVLAQRLKRFTWNDLVPFNIKVLRGVFRDRAYPKERGPWR